MAKYPFLLFVQKSGEEKRIFADDSREDGRGEEVQTNGHKERGKGKKKPAFNPLRPPFPSSGPFFCASLNVVSSFFPYPSISPPQRRIKHTWA